MQEILDRDGNKIDAGNPQCSATPVVAPGVAQGAIDTARCPVGDRSATTKCGSWSTADFVHNIVGRPVAGKTGTTDGNRTATLTVTTKQLAISGFEVDPDWPMRMDGGSGDVINKAVANTLKAAMASRPSVEFTTPPQNIISGSQANLVSVPSVTCQSLDSAKSKISKAGLVPTVGGQVASDCPAGTAAGTNPGGKVTKGSSVEIQVSKGRGNALPVLPNATQTNRQG